MIDYHVNDTVLIPVCVSAPLSAPLLLIPIIIDSLHHI